MSGLAAGSLNSKITLLKRGAGRDALNQPTVGAWTDYADTWANIRTPTGMSALRSQQDSVQAPLNRYSFRVRFREDMAVADAIRYRSQIFNIIDIRHDYAGKNFTDFVCEVGGVDA